MTIRGEIEREESESTKYREKRVKMDSKTNAYTSIHPPFFNKAAKIQNRLSKIQNPIIPF